MKDMKDLEEKMVGKVHLAHPEKRAIKELQGMQEFLV